MLIMQAHKLSFRSDPHISCMYIYVLLIFLNSNKILFKLKINKVFENVSDVRVRCPMGIRN